MKFGKLHVGVNFGNSTMMNSTRNLSTLLKIIHDNKCINIYTMYLLLTIIHDDKFVNRPPCDMYLAFHIHVASKGPFFVDVNQHYITISLFATPTTKRDLVFYMYESD